MIVLNFTVELEVEKYSYVIKLNGYEFGRVEISYCNPHDEKEALEKAAALWLAERLKAWYRNRAPDRVASKLGTDTPDHG